MRIITVCGTRATVDAGGNSLSVDVSLVPDAAAGDWVILHAGFAIQKYSPEEAEETLDLFREIAESMEGQ